MQAAKRRTNHSPSSPFLIHTPTAPTPPNQIQPRELSRASEPTHHTTAGARTNKSSFQDALFPFPGAEQSRTGGRGGSPRQGCTSAPPWQRNCRGPRSPRSLVGLRRALFDLRRGLTGRGRPDRVEPAAEDVMRRRRGKGAGGDRRRRRGRGRARGGRAQCVPPLGRGVGELGWVSEGKGERGKYGGCLLLVLFFWGVCV